MRRTYDLFYSVGNEPLKKTTEMYAENDSEIIKTALEMMLSLKSEYSEIKVELIAKQGDRQVLHFVA